MLFSDLLSPDRIFSKVRASSKKRLLEQVSDALVRNDSSLNARQVFESLCARERLGSTGLGRGVAIPHGRIEGQPVVQAVFVRLTKPLDFDSVDGQPVDLLFGLIVPENCTGDHLKLLSHIAEQFSDDQLLKDIRAAEDNIEIFELLTGTQQ